MKNQLMTLVIGILIGAVITTGVFLVLKDDNKNNNKFPEMNENNRPSFNREERKSYSKDDTKKEETKDTQSNKN